MGRGGGGLRGGRAGPGIRRQAGQWSAAGAAQHQAQRLRGLPDGARRRPRARGRAGRGALQVAGWQRGPDGLRGKAHTYLQWVMIETTYAGSFIAGSEHGNSGDPLPVVNPADGQPFAEVAGATAEDVDAA